MELEQLLLNIDKLEEKKLNEDANPGNAALNAISTPYKAVSGAASAGGGALKKIGNAIGGAIQKHKDTKNAINAALDKNQQKQLNELLKVVNQIAKGKMEFTTIAEDQQAKKKAASDKGQKTKAENKAKKAATTANQPTAEEPSIDPVEAGGERNRHLEDFLNERTIYDRYFHLTEAKQAQTDFAKFSQTLTNAVKTGKVDTKSLSSQIDYINKTYGEDKMKNLLQNSKTTNWDSIKNIVQELDQNAQQQQQQGDQQKAADPNAQNKDAADPNAAKTDPNATNTETTPAEGGNNASATPAGANATPAENNADPNAANNAQSTNPNAAQTDNNNQQQGGEEEPVNQKAVNSLVKQFGGLVTSKTVNKSTLVAAMKQFMESGQ